MDQSILSLGDMLTFIGLVIAAFQLIKPLYSLIWKLTNSFIKSISVALLVVGYLSPLASILIPDTKVLWDGMTLDRMLQTSGFIAITLGLLIVAYIYSRFNYRRLVTVVTKYQFHLQRYPKKKWRNIHFNIERRKIITTRSAKKFYRITSLFLVQGNIKEVVEITRLNLKALVYSARQYSPNRFGLSDEEKREHPKPNGTNYAYETLYQLLTDRAVMKQIVTNDRFFLHTIVEREIDDSDGSLHNEFADVLYTNIVERLVLNTGSFLYTQKDANNGTARFANVYDLLTDEKIIRRQYIIPSMLTWNVMKTSIPLDTYVDVLAKLLERFVDSYKRQPSEELLRNIHSLLDQIMGDDGVTRRISFDKKARKRYADDIANSVEANILRTIELNVVHNFFKDDDPDSFKNSDAEKKAENQQSIYDQRTFTGLVAHKVYELLEDITRLMTDTEDPDDSIKRAFNDYLPLMHTNTAVGNRYKELLYERLFDKAIYGKLEIATNIKGYYPNVMRPLIDMLAPFKTHLDEPEAQAQIKMKSVMANELKDALLSDAKMRNDEPLKDVLLPSSIEADVKKKTVKYYHTNHKGNKTLLDLSEPKATKKK